MKIQRLAAVSLLVIGLTGCGETESANPPDDLTPVEFDTGNSSWNIIDTPADQRLIIEPSSSVTESLLSGITFGLADTDISRSDYRSAAQTWLAHTGRTCTILDSSAVGDSQWQFKYRCARDVGQAYQCGSAPASPAELPPDAPRPVCNVYGCEWTSPSAAEPH